MSGTTSLAILTKTVDKRSRNRTIMDMRSKLISYLGSQPILRIVRGLMLSPEPLHIRELAKRYSMSPSGVSDIIRRLKVCSALKEVRKGNKRCFSLRISQADRAGLEALISALVAAKLEERAQGFSVYAADRLAWMDEAYRFYRSIKRARHDPA